MGMTRRLLVVDGSNLLIRAIKATERSGMSVGDIPTGGLNTFVLSLARYVREEKPHIVVVCWDGGRSVYRTNIDPTYKAARKEREPVIEDAFAQAKEFLTLAGIHHVGIPGVEADDIVASYWRAKGNDDRFVILSGDKDFLQLLDGWTEQIRPGDGNERWTRNRVRTERGCLPEHLPYYMALTGDPQDGVLGVPGVGPKTAVKLLSQHNWDLSALLDAGHPKLFGYRDTVLRALALVDLRTSPVVALPPLPRFTPTTAENVLWEPLLGFLDRYALERIKGMLVQGVLWEARSLGTAARTA